MPVSHVFPFENGGKWVREDTRDEFAESAGDRIFSTRIAHLPQRSLLGETDNQQDSETRNGRAAFKGQIRAPRRPLFILFISFRAQR